MDGELPFYQNREEDILAVSALLKANEAVALPTETVYGLAANAFNPIAISKIFAIKGRPLIDPLIVHVQNDEQASSISEIPTDVKKLMEAFWPGPLTFIVPKKANIPDIVTAGQPFVGIRAPNHPVFQKILKYCGLPLAAPSANPFGYISPTQAAHVRHSLGDKAPYILDGGPCEHGIESTIISFINPSAPQILRPGPIEAHTLEAIIHKPITLLKTLSKNTDQAQLAPGLLSQHYSPRTPLYLVNKTQLNHLESTATIIYWIRPQSPTNSAFWLTETGDGREAAHSLYHLLQTLDKKAPKAIYIEEPPQDSALYEALYNRLIRASKKWA